jgi:CRISPR-associated protein Cas6
VADAQALTGTTLDVAGHALEVGSAKIRPLAPVTTLLARYVVSRENESEEQFVERTAKELQRLGIQVRKLLCGRCTTLDTPDGPLLTRSVMLADLEQEESLRLQETGLGPARRLGCGLFIPHKGIGPVGKARED